MTNEQLRQRMGADATDREAEAMKELLLEQYRIDVDKLDDEPEMWDEQEWGLSDEQFFALVAEAVQRAKEVEK